MQLTALGLTLYLTKVQCCKRIPLLSGGIILSCLLLLRGTVLLFLADFSVLSFSFPELRKWVAPATLHLAETIGDIAAGLAGLAGTMLLSPELIAGLALWMGTRAAVEGVLTCLVWVLALAGLEAGGAPAPLTWRLLAAPLMLGLDAFLLFASARLLLVVALKGAFAPSALHLISEAQHAAAGAAQAACPSCDRRHLLLALLHDEDLCGLLQVGGMDVAAAAAALEPPAGAANLGPQGRHRGFPLGSDLKATALAALRLRERMGDDRVRADHLVLALCGSGEIVVDLGPARLPISNRKMGDRVLGFPVNARVMRDHLEEMKRHAQAVGVRSSSPGPRVFGCLPLEGVVACYAALQAVFHVVSLGCLAFIGDSWAPLLGLETVNHVLALELFEGVLGAGCCAAALAGVWGHWAGRTAVKEAARARGARWDAELDVAFDAVRGEAKAVHWFQLLRRGADCMGLLLIWTVAEALIDVPVLGLTFASGNVCRTHSVGIASIAAIGHGRTSPVAPMHCSNRDILFLTAMAALLTFKAYMAWCVLALWHQYARGWTTTDFRGSAYLDLAGPLPEAACRALAGLPRRPPPGVGVTETTPLML